MEINFESIIKKIKSFIIDGIFKDKYVVVFGANGFSFKTIDILQNYNIKTNAIIDNDINKIGEKRRDIVISSPEILLNTYKENAIILISSKYYADMKRQLEQMGYVENKNIYEVIPNDEFVKKVTLSEFYYETSYLYKGYESYVEILKEYNNKKLLLCPYSSIGDIYLLGLYLNSQEKYVDSNNYVLIVIGNACLEITKMFNFKNIKVINEEKMNSILKLYRFIGEENTNVEILHFSNLYTNIVENLFNYNGLSFTELYSYVVFKASEDLKLHKVKLKDKRTKGFVEKLFCEKGLKKFRTVILSPYAKSLPSMPMNFWEKLTDELHERGYTVCTNINGNDELPIRNTISLSFTLNEAQAVVEHAGYFIGIRSGLCDIVGNCECKKIVLYPQEWRHPGKPINFYGFKNIELYKDIIDVEYVTSKQCIENILEQL